MHDGPIGPIPGLYFDGRDNEYQVSICSNYFLELCEMLMLHLHPSSITVTQSLRVCAALIFLLCAYPAVALESITSLFEKKV